MLGKTHLTSSDLALNIGLEPSRCRAPLACAESVVDHGGMKESWTVTLIQAWNVRAFLRCVVFSENMFKCAELSDEMTKCVEFHGMCSILSFFNLRVVVSRLVYPRVDVLMVKLNFMNLSAWSEKEVH